MSPPYDDVHGLGDAGILPAVEQKYGDDWESKFRQKYESEMIQRDTHFYVGTVHQHPAA